MSDTRKKKFPDSLPTDLIKHVIFRQLELKETIKVAHASKQLNSLFKEVKAPLNTAHQLRKLLQHVAFGEQEEAEAMLKVHPELLLKKANVTDYSGRTFKNITAFQYALWALDRHMWKMIREYLPNDAAREQLEEHESKDTEYTKEHGVHYNFNELIDALNAYIDNYNHWTPDQSEHQWSKIIGSAQRKAPAHIAHEYCREDRGFDPTPDFKESKLPRTVALCLGPAWFPIKNIKVIFNTGIYRAWWNKAGRTSGSPISTTREDAECDKDAMVALKQARMEELCELRRELLMLGHIVAPPKKTAPRP